MNSFSTKTIFIPKIIFLFFLFHKQSPKPEGKNKKPNNICCQKSDTSYFTLLKDKRSSSESTRLDLEHLHCLLNKNWCLLCCFSSPIPVSWSADQPFSEQDPVVVDNYWNKVLAKTSRDIQLSPWQDQEHLNHLWQILIADESKVFWYCLKAVGDLCTHWQPSSDSWDWLTHIWKMLFPPALRTLGIV